MSSPGLSPKPPPIPCHLTIKLSFSMWRRGAAHTWGRVSTSQDFVWESTCTTYCLHAFLERTCILCKDMELSPPPSVDHSGHLNDAFCLDWRWVGGTWLFSVPTFIECFTDYFPITPLEWPSCHLQTGSHLVSASVSTSHSWSGSPGVLVLIPWTEISNLVTSFSPNLLIS